MGFFKFLKRDKKKDIEVDLDKLDTPPAPPQGQSKSWEDFSKMPDLPDDKEFPQQNIPQPESAQIKKQDYQQFQQPHSQSKAPEFQPPFEKDASQQEFESESQVPQMPQQEPQPSEIPRPLPDDTHPEKKYFDEFESGAVKQERKVLSHKDIQGPIFLKVDGFREILTNMNSVKRDVKSANEHMNRINDIDRAREKEFEKWHNIVVDIQKKLIFIDKTLFKGDKK